MASILGTIIISGVACLVTSTTTGLIVRAVKNDEMKRQATRYENLLEEMKKRAEYWENRSNIDQGYLELIEAASKANNITLIRQLVEARAQKKSLEMRL